MCCVPCAWHGQSRTAYLLAARGARGEQRHERRDGAAGPDGDAVLLDAREAEQRARGVLLGRRRAGAQRVDERLDGARRRDGGAVPLLEREVEQRGDRALLRHGVGAPQQRHERRDVRPVLRRILAAGGFFAEEAFLAGARRPRCWCRRRPTVSRLQPAGRRGAAAA